MSDSQNFSHPLKIFITHGHDPVSKTEVLRWLKRRKRLSVEPIDFENAVHSGDAIYATIERVASEGDAAIILATPDDVGRLATNPNDTPRARQNVWLELGWFWARLGRRRTLLLVKGQVDIPSNYSGIIYLNYQNSLSEVSLRLDKFFASLRTLESDSLTELVYLSSDPLARDKQWEEIHSAAVNNLIITGISMRAVRHTLTSLLSSLRYKPNMSLDFVVVHPQFTQENMKLFEEQHGVNAVRENHSFFGDLLNHLKDFEDVAERIRLFLYQGLPPFAAVVADGPSWGSTMIAQPFVPKPREHSFNYPRFKLKRRTEKGVFMTYWNAIEEFIVCSPEPVKGVKQLEALVAAIAAMHNRK